MSGSNTFAYSRNATELFSSPVSLVGENCSPEIRPLHTTRIVGRSLLIPKLLIQLHMNRSVVSINAIRSAADSQQIVWDPNTFW
jgi:hypothetical protein